MKQALYLSLHLSSLSIFIFFFFFFNDTATTEIYTLSLHDALPICHLRRDGGAAERQRHEGRAGLELLAIAVVQDRKSTRLNSSHLVISYAVFCLKKKKNITMILFKSVS